jgi:dienelactone hydrolase
MKYFKILLLLVLTFLFFNKQSYAQRDLVISRSNKAFEWFQQEKFDSIYSLFDAEMKRKLDVSKIEGVWEQFVMMYGNVSSSDELKVEEVKSHFVTKRSVKLEKGKITLSVNFDSLAQIAGLFIRPGEIPYTPADYVNAELFTELRIEYGGILVKNSGRLSIPKSKTPMPVVIIVPGSGGIDKDCSIGPNKIYKDLAWGLASKGIAAFRYDKKTHQYLNKLLEDDSLGKEPFTVENEYLQDLEEIITAIAARKEINPHPMFNKKFKNIAGFISMAGTLREIPSLAIEQIEYINGSQKLASKDSIAMAELKEKMQNSTRARIHSMTTNAQLMGPYTLDYWKYLASYYPEKLALKINKPLYVLQGQRDYQVKMIDFDIWKKTMKDKKQVSFKSYPSLNHLFIEGKGPSMPKEYTQAGNMSEEVVNDIVNWLKGQAERK